MTGRRAVAVTAVILGWTLLYLLYLGVWAPWQGPPSYSFIQKLRFGLAVRHHTLFSRILCWDAEAVHVVECGLTGLDGTGHVYRIRIEDGWHWPSSGPELVR